jgi:Putative peptidase family
VLASKGSKFVLVSVSFLSLTQSVFAATGVDNGVDKEDLARNSAWFLGDAPIKYCIEVDSEKLGIQASEAEQSLQRALSAWKKYLKTRIEYTGKPKQNSSGSGFKEPYVSVDFSFDAACEEKTDLRFLFATSSPEINKALKRFVNPNAYALRTQYSLNAGRGKGFVWVAPSGTNKIDWKKPKVLQTVLMHEIGHIFGIGHIPNTVMREDLADFLVSDGTEWGKTYLGEVDQFAQLARPLNQAVVFRDSLAGNSEFIGLNYSIDRAFSLLTGERIPGSSKSGEVIVKSKLIKTPMVNEQKYLYDLSYSFLDRDYHFRIEKNLLGSISVVSSPQSLFKRFFFDPRYQTGVQQNTGRIMGDVSAGTIKGLGGETFPVVISDNATYQGGGLHIQLMHPEGPFFLFLGEIDSVATRNLK